MLQHSPNKPTISIGFFLERILTGELKHTDSLIMNNAMRSLRVTYDKDRPISLDRDKRDHKIDGAMAAICAFNAFLVFKDLGGLPMNQRAKYIQSGTAI